MGLGSKEFVLVHHCTSWCTVSVEPTYSPADCSGCYALQALARRILAPTSFINACMVCLIITKTMMRHKLFYRL